MNVKLGLSGRIAAAFQSAQITPLLALVALLLGLFAVLVTPREEEPQINVTMANVIIAFPGASVQDVERQIAIPAEQVFARISDVEHVYSVSQPGVAILTIQFKVGIERNDALVRMYDTVQSHADWLPRDLGVQPPLIRPKGIDDVPIVSLTLYSQDPEAGAYALEDIAYSLESELKRIPGTRDIETIGAPGRNVIVTLDPSRMAAHNVTVTDLHSALRAANQGMPIGELLRANQSIALEVGKYLSMPSDVEDLVVGVHDGKAVFIRDVATVVLGPLPSSPYVWFGTADDQASEYPAVTLTITKKPGENAIDVAEAVMHRVNALKNTLIPETVIVVETRDYGATANEKARQLIQKLIFATLSVVALVYLVLGRREAAILGIAVGLTLAATLFLSWAWGFTLNRVSLFALIFSIGILVDDAIVVVENIHRHQRLMPGTALEKIIPSAVDEVGGPTILATFTVIAALLPMAFVTGLMGPYMSPIPINASMGMLLSLIIAFTLTPWMARLWLKPVPAQTETQAPESRIQKFISRLFDALFRPFLDERRGQRNRRVLGVAVLILIGLSVALPVARLVILKMLPFDNKSEFQVIVDMPADTPLEKTAAVLKDLGSYIATVPEVTNYQAYAGTAAPINFNGLVRQYYLRTGGNVGDIQVNLKDKSERQEQSHDIATRIRPALQEIGRHHNANVKVVEVPPGPPVMAPIVAEIYGPDAEGRLSVARAVRQVFTQTPGMVDIDDSSISKAPRKVLVVDRQKAAQLGIAQDAIVTTLAAGLPGQTATWMRDHSKYPTPAVLQLPADEHGSLDALLSLKVRSAHGQQVAVRELISIVDTEREQPVHRKDLLPVTYVFADMAGAVDSPLYGMFSARPRVMELSTPAGNALEDYFISAPVDSYGGYAVKWDGEWQITYETFRDMGAAYAVGLVLIYLLVVAHFGSYLIPLIIMAPIPLTLIGVMPGHALLGAQFTATSMIGMIALAGIIVRNSILLVDFILMEIRKGTALRQAVLNSAIARAQPIALTAVAAMLGALFILDDPIFNGLAVSLIFGVFVSTLLTLVVIPLMFYATYRQGRSLPATPGEI